MDGGECVKVPNFTVWFIIAIFFIGTIAIFVYEHFRFSPFALQVDFEVAKEYIFDRHVNCYNPDFRNNFRLQQVSFKNRLTPYEFALEISKVLSQLKDDTTRIEVPVRKIDKVLPIRCKYISGEVIVVESLCEIPQGSKILSINGKPVEQVLEKYSKLYPNLSSFEAKYSFVDKQLPYYLKIIDANSLHIVYQEPDSQAQRSTYIKGIDDFPTKKKIIDVQKFDNSFFVKINSFKISSKEDMAYISEQFERIAYESTSTLQVVFDLRYASDGDETIPTAVLSYLIDKPTDLYPKLYVRYKDRLIPKSQIPVNPSERKINGDVYFLVDETCFYRPHKVILGFVSQYSLGTIVSSSDSFKIPGEFYIDEFWKILPSTRSYIVFPTGKVILEKIPDVSVKEGIDLDYGSIINSKIYEKYLKECVEKINHFKNSM